MLTALYSWLRTAKASFVLALLLLSGPTATQAVPFDFTYVYSDPFSFVAQTHIVSTTNAHLYDEGFVRMWIPVVGGSTPGNHDAGRHYLQVRFRHRGRCRGQSSH